MRHACLAAAAALALSGCSGAPDADVPGPLRDLADAVGYRIVSAAAYRAAEGETLARGLVLVRETAGAGAPERLRVAQARALAQPDGRVRISLHGVTGNSRGGGSPVDVVVDGEPGIPFRTLALSGSRGADLPAARLELRDVEWARGVLLRAAASLTFEGPAHERRKAVAAAGGTLAYDAARSALALREVHASLPTGERLHGSASFRDVGPSTLASLAYAALAGPGGTLPALAGLRPDEAALQATHASPHEVPSGAAWRERVRGQALSWLMRSPQGPWRAAAANALAGFFAGASDLRLRLSATDAPALSAMPGDRRLAEWLVLGAPPAKGQAAAR